MYIVCRRSLTLLQPKHKPTKRQNQASHQLLPTLSFSSKLAARSVIQAVMIICEVIICGAMYTVLSITVHARMYATRLLYTWIGRKASFGHEPTSLTAKRLELKPVLYTNRHGEPKAL